FTSRRRAGISGPPLGLHWRSTSQRLRSLKDVKHLRWTSLLNRRWSSRRYWHRLRPLHRQKIFRSPSLLLLQTLSRNLSKKEHRHRGNHRRRRKNSCQSKPLGRCRCRERKPSPCTRPGPSTHTRRVRDTLRGVE